jgi:guanine deaminase
VWSSGRASGFRGQAGSGGQFSSQNPGEHGGAVQWLGEDGRDLARLWLAREPPQGRASNLTALTIGGLVPLASMATEEEQFFMREAIRLMREAGISNKTGGPFGALVVKDGNVVGVGGNTVILDNDPSGHGEVNAIRHACKTLGRWNLSDCVLYTSCQCCPMCYSTAYWARIKKIYYAASWADYDDCFRQDTDLKQDLEKPISQSQIPQIQILRSEAVAVWNEFRNLPDGARY